MSVNSVIAMKPGHMKEIHDRSLATYLRPYLHKAATLRQVSTRVSDVVKQL